MEKYISIQSYDNKIAWIIDIGRHMPNKSRRFQVYMKELRIPDKPFKYVYRLTRTSFNKKVDAFKKLKNGLKIKLGERTMIRIKKIKKVANRLQEKKETFCHVSLKGTNLASPIGGFRVSLCLENKTIHAKLHLYNGKSVCCEGDNFNIALGIRLAISRCINKMMGQVKSQMNTSVKNTQKELDRIVDYQKNLKDYTNHLINKTDNHVNKDS